jgi:hypothetical protein
MRLRDKLKKALHDASVNISNTYHDASVNVSNTAHAAAKSVGDAIGDKLGGGVAVHAMNKVNPAIIIMRAAIISILDINLVGIASAMNIIKAKRGKHWAEIQQKWWMFGGEKANLDKQVDKGKNRKPLFSELLKKFHHADGYNSADGANAGKQVATAAAGLSVISTVLLAVPEPSGTTKAMAAYTASGAGVLGGLKSVMKGFALENGASAADVAGITTHGLDPSAAALEGYNKANEATKTKMEDSITDGVGATIWGISKPVFYIGSAILGAGIIGFIVLAFRKKE